MPTREWPGEDGAPAPPAAGPAPAEPAHLRSTEISHNTLAGSRALAIPKLGRGPTFPWLAIEAAQGAERALISVVRSCYLLGVRPPDGQAVHGPLGVTGLSKAVNAWPFRKDQTS
jgi:hypothetical protein